MHYNYRDQRAFEAMYNSIRQFHFFVSSFRRRRGEQSDENGSLNIRMKVANLDIEKIKQSEH